MPHANALLTERGRLKLAQCIVEDGWPLRRCGTVPGLGPDRVTVGRPVPRTWCPGGGGPVVASTALTSPDPP